ncbi:MAG: ABC transporter permease [Thermoproteus sp. AZ2]|jgi:simple sugar transport system permease protein|uniref:ABC transporter permease n=1 Tax=Thermoproteus sp. AZ2 TaxID=1609232 RepID=A0ACC6V3F4_9CREN
MRIIDWFKRIEVQLAIVDILVALFFGFLNPLYFAWRNIAVVLQYATEIGMVAIAETLLMIEGEIDMSPAAVANFVPLIALTMYNTFTAFGIPGLLSMLITTILSLGLGALIGLLNGVITTKAKVNSLITTVGTLFLFNGLALIYSGGYPQPFPYFFFMGGTAKVPMPFVWSFAVFAIVLIFYLFTRFGVWVVATGSNYYGAYAAGVPVDRVKIATFVISAVIATLMGIVESVRITTVGATDFTTDIVLEGIAASVIGGTLLTGGKGSLIGAILGTFFISELLNGFNLLGINAYEFSAIVGAAILIVMTAQNIIQKRTAQR